MIPIDALQLMRTCNSHQVLKQLEYMERKHPIVYDSIIQFYEEATKRGTGHKKKKL